MDFLGNCHIWKLEQTALLDQAGRFFLDKAVLILKTDLLTS